ncbi:cytosine-specific DNA methylase, putative [Trypanosoma equiperdum]|uniref:DNA (cytosine-5-)-methyltransferase n=1 Tax=Trypanosoma equiperdum TaxID=5694 RepID=A0A1G4ICI8_TRYEQ|nr:cytosine-specific DNA methylase, putative [Trypanosoma equiperdum]
MCSVAPLASHGTGCPVAACIVRCKRHLSAVVCRLRKLKRLRSGRNVTTFNANFYEAVAEERRYGAFTDGEHFDDCTLHLRRWMLRRVTCAPTFATSVTGSVETNEVLTMWTKLSDGGVVWNILQKEQQCYAVHFIGELSSDFVKELFNCTVDEYRSGSHNGVVLCIVQQLRVYSEACCRPEDFPPPLYELRAAALRTQVLHQCGSAGAFPTSTKLGKRSENGSDCFTFSELFAGMGMFRVGLERIGGKCVFAVECAPHARSVYHANHHLPRRNSCGNEALPATRRPVPLVGDITTVPSHYFPHHDVLTAGFPCQSFAKAGSATGLRDTKGQLFYEVVRVIQSAKPKAFLLENVENVLHVGGEDGGEANASEESQHHLKFILDALRSPSPDSNEALTYVVAYRVIDGALVTPQRRRRAYFVGIRADLPRANARDVGAVLDDAVRQLRAYRDMHPEAPRCVRDILDSTGDTSEMGEFNQSLVSLRLTESQWAAVQRSVTFRRSPSWRVSDLNGLARTLMGSYRASYQLYSEFVPLPDGGPPFRFYSIRECARLQGIPDWFSFNVVCYPLSLEKCNGRSGPSHGSDKGCERCVPVGAVYKLIGNAVNPIVVECLGRALLSRILK